MVRTRLGKVFRCKRAFEWGGGNTTTRSDPPGSLQFGCLLHMLPLVEVVACNHQFVLVECPGATPDFRFDTSVRNCDSLHENVNFDRSQVHVNNNVRQTG